MSDKNKSVLSSTPFLAVLFLLTLAVGILIGVFIAPLKIEGNIVSKNGDESQDILEDWKDELSSLDETIVKRIIDGDTIELDSGERVRLLGINAPERGQRCYNEAKERLEDLLEGKQVRLQEDENPKDQYGRFLRYIYLDNLNVNIQLVKEGFATVFVISPNTKHQTELEEAENFAQKEEGCIWKKTKLSGNNICDNNCIGISFIHSNAEGDDCSNLNDEYIKIRNSCGFSCNLTDWTVTDETSRDPYKFRQFVLEGNSGVTLYTGCGKNSQNSIYWCSSGRQCNAVWNNAKDTIFVRNENEELILNVEYSNQ